jgi:hypothetical protein
MKNLEYVVVETTFNALFNPFNNKIEYIIAHNKRFQLSIPYSTNSAFNPISTKSKFNSKNLNNFFFNLSILFLLSNLRIKNICLL